MEPRLRIKMYRHGLGDCFLLRFAMTGNQTFNILIDCGIITVAKDSKATMSKVVNDIKKSCKDKIDIVVMTHEHWDHASGFSRYQAQEIFEGIEIKEVWYAWTEDPKNELGMKLRKERADKVNALVSAVGALNGIHGNSVTKKRAEDLISVLGFFGLDQLNAENAKPIGRTREAFEYLKGRNNVKTKYCYPEQPPIHFEGVNNVRVFVLGPPQNELLIKKSVPSKKHSQVYDIASEPGLAENLLPAFDRLKLNYSDKYDDCPFDSSFYKTNRRRSKDLNELIAETWDDTDNDWRKIETDWTREAESLALNLDTHTNNTCLVLAFQFVDTGEVFLFPADAQVGNWLSWQDRKWEIKTPETTEHISGTDLLNKTVFYKVGHHGSHNATLKSLGLELMNSEDLIAFIPVNEVQAKSNRWDKMPFLPLVKRLEEKTNGRLLRSDQIPPKNAQLSGLSLNKKNQFLEALETKDLYFEYRF